MKLLARRAVGGGRAVGALHHRPPPARQGHRRDRRSRRGAAPAAESKQKKVIGKIEIEEHRLEDRAHSAAVRRRNDDRSKLADARPRPEDASCSGRTRPSRRWSAPIKMARSGLGKPDKPIGAFLFSGPTGVGKTEVARQLAFTLGIELQRFDMSEYMERHAVSPPDRRAAGIRRASTRAAC